MRGEHPPHLIPLALSAQTPEVPSLTAVERRDAGPIEAAKHDQLSAKASRERESSYLPASNSAPACWSITTGWLPNWKRLYVQKRLYVSNPSWPRTQSRAHQVVQLEVQCGAVSWP